MPTCAAVVAPALAEEGVTRMFGLPGGEILEFIEAAPRGGIEFDLVRDEGTASFMADVTGQMQRRPGVCVSTLGPGAVKMTLGVAHANLDRSPLIAVTASMDGVEYGKVDFAAAGRALDAWTRAVGSLDDLADSIREAGTVNRPVLIDVEVDPAVYGARSGLFADRRARP